MYQHVIGLPDDFHVHFRAGKMLENIIGGTVPYYGRATIMPNLHPDPVLTAEHARDYESDIRARMGDAKFTPIMTIQVTEATTPDLIKDAAEAGITAGKIYPFGVTTNSQNGVKHYRSLKAALAGMESHRMIALFHGEHPGEDIYCLDRERDFFRHVMPWVVKTFPRLRIVVEHLTTAVGIRFVLKAPPNVAATITVHHLFLTTDDVLGGRSDPKGSKLQPHHFCKPVAKREGDRQALLRAATSGNPKFFLGTDSAPHDVTAKECRYGCAGVYVPGDVAIPLLVEEFRKWHGGMRTINAFTSDSGRQFYGLPPNEETLIIDMEDWQVPDSYNGVVPFYAGEVLPFKVVGRGAFGSL